MDNNITSWGLVTVSLVLALALITRHQAATNQRQTDEEIILKLHGAVKNLETLATEQRGENVSLAEKAKAREEATAAFSNKLETATSELGLTKQSLVRAQADIETVKTSVVAAQAETRIAEARAAAERAQFEKAIADYQRAVKERDAALANLSQANEQMGKQAEQLATEITRQQATLKAADAKLDAKEKQVQSARSEREQVARELKEMTERRAGLERQLSDADFLRDHLAHLKAEQAAARRAAAARQDKPGAKTVGASASKPTGPLMVELQRDGSVTLTPIGTPVK